MYPSSDSYQAITRDLGKVPPKMQESRVLSECPQTTPPPPVDASEDSLPLSDLSNSPSPTAGRRMSLLSDVSVTAPGPLTPSKRLFEDIIVNEDSRYSVGNQRIHSTPYPKPRLPTQLTPHPQARITSLPEYSRNRNPFLESLRNPRSVSSPVRLKPAPLSPIYHEVEDAESSFEVSEHSSTSALPPHRFPFLMESHQQSPEVFQPDQLDPSQMSSDQPYTAPYNLCFTPPSFQSLILSPFTTGLDRPIPTDRPLVPQRDDLDLDRISEEEVLMMLHQTSLETPYQPCRSSIPASATSHVSSPESSVVFLSPTTKLPGGFLSARHTTSRSTHRSTPSLEPIPQEHDEATHLDDSQDDLHSEQRPLSGGLELSRPKKDSRLDTRDKNILDIPKYGCPQASTLSSVDPKIQSDWILFEDAPKPIPALHGPPSLPYARCPSGAEGVIIDGSQPVDDLIWGLSEDTMPYSRSNHAPEYGERQAGVDRQPVNFTCQAESTQDNNLAVDSRPWNNSTSALQNATSAAGNPAIPSGTKEKHVRFLDDHTNKAAAQPTLENVQSVGSQPQSHTVTHRISGNSGPTAEDLARILQDQMKRASMAEMPERAKVSTPNYTLDQLRRFGVPFRPHPTAQVDVKSHAPNPRFRFVTKSSSLAELLASQSDQQPLQDRYLSARYDPEATPLMSNSFGPSGLGSYPPQASSVKPCPSSGSHSPPNFRSIPLLRLRQRQHEENQRAQTYPIEGDSDDRSRRPHTQGDTRDRSRVASEFRSHLKSSRPLLNQEPAKEEIPMASASASLVQVGSSASTGHSPNRRRSRRGGKRPASQQESPQKENDQAGQVASAIIHKPASRQTGRKKGRQRSRTSSLPQSTSRGE